MHGNERKCLLLKDRQDDSSIQNTFPKTVILPDMWSIMQVARNHDKKNLDER